jgi:hypothetical protein
MPAGKETWILKVTIKNNISVALVRERIILTKQPPLVGEVSANFYRLEGCRVVIAVDSYGCNYGFPDRKV